MAEKARIPWSLLIRIVIAVPICYYLYELIDWNSFFRVISDAEVGWILIAAGCYGITTTLGIIRWHLLLKTCHAEMKFTRTAQLTMIGLFANLFLPSSMMGDLLKGYYASREIPHIKPTVIMSIIMERLLGFIAMFLISTTLILFRFDALTAEPATKLAVYLYFGLFGLIFGIIALGSWKKLGNYIPLWKRLPIEEQLREAGTAYRFFLRHQACFWGGLALSCIAHFTLMGTFYFVSVGLNMHLNFWDLAAVLPLIMVVNMIPLTPGGIGLREVAFTHFLQFAHMTEEASVALSLGGTAVIYLMALPGGLVLLQFRSRKMHQADQK
ncbi:MAG: lysylphosphatidylglycerol synthase transmembrane domain-containing protein [Verrucomicrobiota bacterium]